MIDLAITDALAEALEKAIGDSDYCYACDMHPHSHGHADDCPLVAYQDQRAEE